TVDVHQLVGELALALLAVAAVSSRKSCHGCLSFLSEFQSALAGGIGQRLDAAVIFVGASIENDGADAGLRSPLGDQPSDLGGSRLVRAGPQLAPEILLEARGCSDRLTLRVVDDLRIDVLGRAEDRQPRPPVRLLLQRAAHAPLAPFKW